MGQPSLRAAFDGSVGFRAGRPPTPPALPLWRPQPPARNPAAHVGVRRVNSEPGAAIRGRSEADGGDGARPATRVQGEQRALWPAEPLTAPAAGGRAPKCASHRRTTARSHLRVPRQTLCSRGSFGRASRLTARPGRGATGAALRHRPPPQPSPLDLGVLRQHEPVWTLGAWCPGVQPSTGNDPSAGSPTETLLRLLLPLDSQV